TIFLLLYTIIVLD
ncbi:Crescent membrane and immature virion formation protein, partial [Monkeypox virus]